MVSPHHFFRTLIYLVIALMIVALSYAAVYYWTYYSKIGGTGFDLLKGDVIQSQEQEKVRGDLEELGYRISDLFPVGNHRSTQYFADVLNAYDAQRVKRDEEPGTYLMRDDAGEYHFVTVDERGEIEEVVELRE